MKTSILSKYVGLLKFLALAVYLTGLVSTPVRAESDEEFKKSFEKYLESEAGKEKIAKSMQEYFAKQQQNAQKDAAQKAEKDIEEQFKNPIKFDVGKSPFRGNKDAKVTIVEFSDYQCPFCKRGFETMEKIREAYPKDVKVYFKNLPLPFHPNADPAARATLAAEKQGKYWELHDALFTNQDKLSEAYIMEQAGKLGLNMDKFKADMNSEEIKKALKEDTEAAGKLGIQGTPGYLVNGVLVKGAYPFEHFKQIIDRWLGAAAAPAAAPAKS